MRLRGFRARREFEVYSVIGIRKSLLALAALVGLVGATGNVAEAQNIAQPRPNPTNPFVPVKDPGEIGGAAVKDRRENAWTENKGQWDDNVLFYSARNGIGYWVMQDGLRMDVYRQNGNVRVGHAVDMTLVSGTPERTTVPSQGAPAYKTDYLYYKNRGSFRGVGSFAEVRLNSVAPNIDARYYTDKGNPRYDFIVNPGGRPSDAAIEFKGADGISIDANGDILIKTELRTVRQAGLKVYQEFNGKKKAISARFVMRGESTVGFEIGAYDKTKKLVIDPIVYGTYVGGDAGADDVRDVASNNSGQVYITGSTQSDFFPVTAGVYSLNLVDGQDAYIVALTGDAYDVSYAAFIGGLGQESGQNLQIDQYGNVWLAGNTTFGLKGMSSQMVKAGSYEALPTAGAYKMSFEGEQTDLIAFDANAAAIEAALDLLPTAPPGGGFTVTGGPLPATPIVIRRADGELMTSAVSVTTPIKGYSLAGTVDNFTMSWTAPTNTNFGFRPNGGFFRFAVVRAGATSFTRWLPFDATAGQIVGALSATPVSLTGVGTGDPTAELPTGVVDIQIDPTNNVTGLSVQTRADDTNNSGNVRPQQLQSGYYAGFNTGLDSPFASPQTRGTYPDATSGQQRAFVMRFASLPGGLLDPFDDEIIKEIGAPNAWQTNVKGFAIKPVNIATGNVEITIGGNTMTALPEITGSAFPGPPGRFQAGYILQSSYTNGSGTLVTDAARSSYIDGTLFSVLAGLTVDPLGAVYVTGTVSAGGNIATGPASTTFRTTTGVFTNGNLIRFGDAYVRKYSPTGALLYSAVIGGSGNDDGCAIAVDNLGNAYVAGIARSFNFPRTVGSFGQIFNSSRNVVVTKINPTATQIIYSTNLRTSGAVQPRSIAVDSRGNAYIGGLVSWTAPFAGATVPAPVGPGAIQITPVAPLVPNQTPGDDNANEGGTGNFVSSVEDTQHFYNTPVALEGFLSVLNSTATGLLYGSYIGTAGYDDVYTVRVDSADSVYVGGKYAGDTGKAMFDASIQTYFHFFTGFITYGISGGAEQGQTLVQNDTGRAFATNYGMRWIGTPGFATLVEYPGQAIIDTVTPTLLGTGIPDAFITTLGFKTNQDPSGGGDGFMFKSRIALPALAAVTLTPDQVAGGRGSTSTGQVRLQNPAPVGGAQVTIRVLQPTVARVTANGATRVRITIPAGQTVGAFTVFSRTVTTPTFCDVRAELDGDFLVARLSVRPWLDSITLSTDEIPGGNSLQATVTLFQPAPAGGVDVGLSSDKPLVTFPGGTINIPAGQQTATFAIDTEGVDISTDVNITATVDGVGVTQPLRLLPASVVSVAFNPSTINGGESSTGTIFLDGKTAAGQVITLSQTGQAITIPASIVTTAGQTSVEFTATAPAVTAATTSTSVQATLNGVSASGTLIIEGNDILSIQLSTNSVIGGGTVIGTVNLARAASPSGFVVPLLNNNTVAGTLTPTSVTILPGATAASFTIQTVPVSTTQNLVVTANKTGYNAAAATLQVRALALNMVLNPSSVPGGTSSTATISLAGNEVAPPGGLLLSLGSNNVNAQVPPTVTIPAGLNSTTFTITTNRVATDVIAVITAGNSSGSSVSRNLTVQAPSLSSVTVAPTNPVGGSNSTGTVTISSPAPVGGLVINLSSSNGAASVPSTVTVASGATTATFTVTTNPVSAATPVTITATRGSQTRTASITVQVAGIASLVFNPSTVKGGNASTGTITLQQAAPAGGLVILLSSNNPTFVSMPASVVVPAGQTQVTFTVNTAQVTRLVGVVITAKVQATNAQLSGTLFIDRNVN
jgi:hypothetical protein